MSFLSFYCTFISNNCIVVTQFLLLTFQRKLLSENMCISMYCIRIVIRYNCNIRIVKFLLLCLVDADLQILNLIWKCNFREDESKDQQGKGDVHRTQTRHNRATTERHPEPKPGEFVIVTFCVFFSYPMSNCSIKYFMAAPRNHGVWWANITQLT
jgi:hypothetical protein